MDADMEISSESDNGDAYVADLLQQFAQPDGPFQNGAGSSHDESDSPDPLRRGNSSTLGDAGTEAKFSIEIPFKEDLSDYEFLPGHSTVNEIIYQSERTRNGVRNGARNGAFYCVRLTSGEKETVRLAHSF
jgi:hypothetical protein